MQNDETNSIVIFFSHVQQTKQIFIQDAFISSTHGSSCQIPTKCHSSGMRPILFSCCILVKIFDQIVCQLFAIKMIPLLTVPQGRATFLQQHEQSNWNPISPQAGYFVRWFVGWFVGWLVGWLCLIFPWAFPVPAAVHPGMSVQYSGIVL